MDAIVGKESFLNENVNNAINRKIDKGAIFV